MRQGNGLVGKLRLQAPSACAVVSQDFTNKKTKVKVKLLRISRQSIKSHGVGGSSESVPYVTKLAAHQ